MCKPFAEELEVVWSNRPLYVAPRAYAVPLIESLKAAGYRIYLLSNYPIVLFEMHKARQCFPFLDLVDGAIISAYERVVKPEPGIYELLLKRYGLEASECIFLDDREENVDAAKALGLKGIVFTDIASAMAALSAEGVFCGLE